MKQLLAAIGVLGSCILIFSTTPVFTQNTTIATPNDTFNDKVELKTPQPRIGIPGLQLTPIGENIDEEEGVIYVSFLGEYIAAVYKYAVTIASLVAVIMVIVAGFQWTASGGSPEMITSAKKRLVGAVTGLILAVGSYVILYAINPELVQFRSLRVKYVESLPFVDSHGVEDDSVQGQVATSFDAPEGGNIIGPGILKVPANLKDPIENVAEELEKTGRGIYIAASFRTVAMQKTLIERNCQNPPGSATCNPKPNRAQTCILKDNNPANCPHTTGQALDIWATEGSEQCVRQETCLKSLFQCQNNPCQKQLIDEMNLEGFCVSDAEPWHFEKPKMSSDCHGEEKASS